VPKSRDGRPADSTRTRQTKSEPHSYASSPGVRSRMQAQRTRDTAPEVAVRRLLHAQGLRYRVDRAPLEGLRRRADIVFGPARVAVFIDGCFWHGCPQHGRARTVANPNYWSEKIARNRARDIDTDNRLRERGWAVIRAWEHEDPLEITRLIVSSVQDRRGLKAVTGEHQAREASGRQESTRSGQASPYD
jgi:DNA mismatch endonuclease (patch repair protein)